MADRVVSLTVILEEPTRDEVARSLADAIGQLRGVREVVLGEVYNVSDYYNRSINAMELGKKVYDFVQEASGMKK